MDLFIICIPHGYKFCRNLTSTCLAILENKGIILYAQFSYIPYRSYSKIQLGVHDNQYVKILSDKFWKYNYFKILI